MKSFNIIYSKYIFQSCCLQLRVRHGSYYLLVTDSYIVCKANNIRNINNILHIHQRIFFVFRYT